MTLFPLDRVQVRQPPAATERVYPAPASLVIDVGETIAAVVGVYLRADSKRTGRNYAATWAGSLIALNGLPTVDIRVVYHPVPASVVPPASLSFREVTLTDGDTIQSLAQTYLGDRSRWQEIVSLNQLDPPFTTADPDFEAAVPARALVRLTRNPGWAGNIPIPTNLIVYAPRSETNNVRLNYKTLEPTTLVAEREWIDVMIEFAWLSDISGTVTYALDAARFGTVGNIPPHALSLVGGITAYGYGEGPYGEGAWGGGLYLMEAVSVDNPWPITTGMVRRVLRTGDPVRIPIAAVDGNNVSQTEDYDRLFGRDAAILNGDLVISPSGDLATVVGSANLKQALETRLATYRGDRPLHPRFGSDHMKAVGRAGTKDELDLLRFEVAHAVASDPRIVSVFDLNVTGENDLFEVDFKAHAIGSSTPSPLNLVVNRG